jgi:hypothetical protein
MSIRSTGASGAEKRFGRIREATVHSGLSRSSLYKLAAAYPGLFRKHGSATIVDFQMLNEILAATPVAEFSTTAV